MSTTEEEDVDGSRNALGFCASQAAKCAFLSSPISLNTLSSSSAVFNDITSLSGTFSSSSSPRLPLKPEPLTIQAAGRALWASYKITDKRVCVISNSPLRKERTDVPMDQIKDVISIGRGIGAWGDMVITLRNDEKVELRSLPNFKELEGEIKQRMYKEKPIEF